MENNKNFFVYEDTKTTIRVTGVEPLDNYLLRLTFSNGKIKIFDFKPYLDKPVFTPLKDKNVFNKAQVKYDTVVWSDKIDFDPESLYWDSVLEKNKGIMAGCMKGSFGEMSDDFNEPLDDFKDYM